LFQHLLGYVLDFASRKSALVMMLLSQYQVYGSGHLVFEKSSGAS
jgi:hypothetical protein